MNVIEFSDKVQELIRVDKIKEAIDAMLAFLKQTPYLEEILAQSGRYHELKHQERLHIVDYNNATIEKNKIRIALLGLLFEIQEKFKTDPKVKEEVAIVDIKKIFRADMTLWILVAMFLGVSAYVTTVPFKMLNGNPPKTVNPSASPIPDAKNSKDTKNHNTPPPTTKPSNEPTSRVPKDTSRKAKTSEGVIRDSSKSKPSIVHKVDTSVNPSVVTPAPLTEETVDKKPCYIITKGDGSTKFHPDTAHDAKKKPVRPLPGNKRYYVLKIEKRNLGTQRYLIKDDDGTEGWVYDSGISDAQYCKP
jgi:Effector-associated domain 11